MLFRSGSFRHKPKFFFNFIGYTSYISGDVATFSGIRLGLNYNKTVKIGIGLAGLNSPVVTAIDITEEGQTYTTNATLNYGYLEGYFEYIFYNKDRWQFSVPIAIGAGSAYYSYVSRTDTTKLIKLIPSSIWTVEPSVAAQYTILRWLGAGASLGYRQTLYAQPKIDENFNSVTFSIGLRLFLDEIYKMIFKKGE